MGKLESFRELNLHYRKGKDYRIISRCQRSDLLVLAPHGGGIEPGTSELARAIAGDDLSLYIFAGIRKANKVLHITSTKFDEPKCVCLLDKSQTSLAIHGCVGTNPRVIIGGRHSVLKQNLFKSLSTGGYDVELHDTGRYAGRWSTNICNRTLSGQGAQLEISTGLRKQLFANLFSLKGRRTVTDEFYKFVAAVRSGLSWKE